MSRCGLNGCASLAGRGRPALVLLAALVLAWTMLALTSASASPQHDDRIAVTCGLAAERGVASSELPRRLEADLPDPVSGALPFELDRDLAASRRIVVIAFTTAPPCAAIQPCAAPVAPA